MMTSIGITGNNASLTIIVKKNNNASFTIFRILRWLRDEEEQQQEQKLSKTEFLIVELSRKNMID